MKKILFLCCSLFIGVGYADAQVVLLNESFESGIPGTWTRQTDPTSNGWQAGTNTSLSSVYWSIPAPAAGTGIVAVNDDACGMSCDAYDWLFSPTFDASGYDSIRINFKSHFIRGTTLERAYVGYNNDGSTNYNGAFLPASAAGQWDSWYLTVPAANLTSTFSLGFFYDDGYEWGYGFAIDDVEVVGYSGSVSVTNDDCADAVSLISSASCTPVSGTVSGATASGLPQACTGGTPSADVWYSFQATSEIATIAAQSNSATASNGFDLVLELYEGTCSGLTFLSCADSDDITQPGATGTESINIDGLTIGNTYYVRVYNYFGTSAVDGGFSICVEERPSCSLTQPAGSIVENETCGGTANNTCATGMDISCGDVVWGTYFANAGTRDLDYYKFTINNPTAVNFTLETEFPGLIILYNAANCNAPVFLDGAYVDGCDEYTLTYNITAAGTYAVLVIPDAYFSPSCSGNNTNYILGFESNAVAPVLSAGGPTTFCTGGNVQLSATGTGTFEWYNGGVVIPGETGTTYTAVAAGDYTVVATDGNGCPAESNSIDVVVEPLDDASFAYASSTICEGGANVIPASVATPGGTFSSTAGLAFADNSTGEIDVVGSAAGSYVITYTTSGTCPNFSTQNITITDAPDASFSYAQSSYCTSDVNPTPVITGSAGVFSADPAGLFINASSGVIDLAGSTAGTYDVTNEIAASGSCPAASETVQVVITEAGDASFVYTETSYCLSGANPSPVITGTAGTFSADPAGLSINASSGEIDLSASSVGTYTVTNEVAASGACPAVTATEQITVTANPDASFTYAATSYCTSDADPSPVVTGAAGTFSATPAGLSINASTGVIDLAASTAGTYTVTNTIEATSTCAAAVETAVVTVDQAPTATVSLSGFTLTAQETGVTYQWVDCSDDSPIAGETSQTYTPSVDGSYAVIVSNGDCSATSACQLVSGLGININTIDVVSVYPNPADHLITINGLTSSKAIVSILDVNGRILLVEETTSAQLDVSVRDFESGVYLIKVESDTINGTKRFIKK